MYCYWWLLASRFTLNWGCIHYALVACNLSWSSISISTGEDRKLSWPEQRWVITKSKIIRPQCTMAMHPSCWSWDEAEFWQTDWYCCCGIPSLRQLFDDIPFSVGARTLNPCWVIYCTTEEFRFISTSKKSICVPNIHLYEMWNWYYVLYSTR